MMGLGSGVDDNRPMVGEGFSIRDRTEDNSIQKKRKKKKLKYVYLNI